MGSLIERAEALRAKFEAAPPVPHAMLAPYILPLLDLLDDICKALEETNDGHP